MVIHKVKLLYILYSVLVYMFFILGSSTLVPPYVVIIIQKMAVLIIAIIVALLLNLKSGYIKRKHLIPILILLAYVLMSLISYAFNFGISYALSLFFNIGVIYFGIFFSILLLTDYYSTLKLFKPFLISSLIIIVLSIMVFFGLKPTYYSDNSSALQHALDLKFGNSLAGFSGLYLNQNTFGIFLIIAIVAIYLTILNAEYISKRYLKALYICFAIALLLNLLTLSRAAVAAAVVIIFLYMARYYKSKSNFSILALITVMIGLSSIYLSDYIKLFADRVETDGSSSRVTIWQDAIEKLNNNIYFGVGDYNYRTAEGVLLNAHNVYLDTLASLGIIGSFFWFLWLLYAFIKAVKSYFKAGSKSEVFICCAFFGVLIHQTVESTIQFTYSPFTLLLILLLACIINNQSDKVFI